MIGLEHHPVAIETATEVSTGPEHPPVAIETAAEAATGPVHPHVAKETAAGAVIGQEHPHVASAEREDDVELAAAGVIRLPENVNRSNGGHSRR